jgi:hypothetical protein
MISGWEGPYADLRRLTAHRSDGADPEGPGAILDVDADQLLVGDPDQTVSTYTDVPTASLPFVRPANCVLDPDEGRFYDLAVGAS